MELGTKLPHKTYALDNIMDKQEVFDNIKTLLEGADALDFKKELITKIGGMDRLTEELGSSNITSTADKLARLRLSQASLLPAYAEGDNFARYCEKFQEATKLSQIEDENLNIWFLQKISDDQTYALLKTVDLSETEKANAELFCEKYKTAYYSEDVSMSLKNELIECKQDAGEPIAKYSFRLSEKANIAYKNQQTAEDNAFIAFMRGVRNNTIRRKLKESNNIDNFKDAVAYAQKLESISKQFADEEPQLASILKETAVSFGDTKEDLENSKLQGDTTQERSYRRSDSHNRSYDQKGRDFRSTRSHHPGTSRNEEYTNRSRSRGSTSEHERPQSRSTRYR